MKRIITFLLLSMLMSLSCSNQEDKLIYDIDEEDVASVPDETNDHPRLIFRKGTETALLRNINSDIRWRRLHEAIIKESDILLSEEPMEYKIAVGGRLHTTSCEVVRRVLFLSYSYRLTGERKYLDRCEEEMLAMTRFPDWNPSHFLDVAEMVMALAFGYDWLYDQLPEISRQTICNAIRDMGLRVSETADDYALRWMEMENNWGQVCHGGLAIAAVAIYKEEPEIAKRIIARSKKHITIPMLAEYPPMGAYPEGIGYWSYGTTINAMFINVMETYFGPEEVADIKAVPGFMQTGNYLAQLITPTLNTFGFSDNSTSLLLPDQIVFWFYEQTKDPSLLYYQTKLVDKFTDPSTDYGNGKPYSSQLVEGSGARHLPLMMVWGAGTGPSLTADMGNAVPPSSLYYISEGKNPICVMRSGWNTEDIYLGFKTGSPSCPHGHMDVGTFQFEWGGARFAVDLGSDSYSKVAGGNIGGSMFDMEQNSVRWNVLTRYNNKCHNTLTINGQHQKVDATSRFIDHSAAAGRMYATGDLTPNYPGQVQSLKRAVALMDNRYGIVEDLLTANTDGDASIVWNMTTKAKTFDFDAATNTVKLVGKTSKGENRILYLKFVLENPEATTSPLSVSHEAVTVNTSYENSASGHYYLRVAYTVKAGKTQRMKCYLLPGDKNMTITNDNFIK